MLQGLADRVDRGQVFAPPELDTRWAGQRQYHLGKSDGVAHESVVDRGVGDDIRVPIAEDVAHPRAGDNM